MMVDAHLQISQTAAIIPSALRFLTSTTLTCAYCVGRDPRKAAWLSLEFTACSWFDSRVRSQIR